MMIPKSPRSALSITLRYNNYKWLMDRSMKKGLKPSHFLDRIIEEKKKTGNSIQAPQTQNIYCSKCGKLNDSREDPLCFGCSLQSIKDEKVEVNK